MRLPVGPFALLLLFAACTPASKYALEIPSSTPVRPFDPPKEGYATVCVIHPDPRGSSATHVIKDNGKLVGATSGPSYFCYYAEPGLHDVSDEGSSAVAARTVVDVKQRYYLHGEVNVGADRLAWVGEEKARKLISDCDYKVITSVPGGETLPAQPPVAQARGGGGGPGSSPPATPPSASDAPATPPASAAPASSAP